MNLATMFALVHSASGNSRSDAEVYAALDEGCNRVYTWIKKETRKGFLKFDTSISLAIGTESYAFPTDTGKIVRVRERLTPATPWQLMNVSDDLTSDAMLATQNSSLSYTDNESTYTYSPYFDANMAKRFLVEPPPQEVRQLEIAYEADYIEITGAGSTVVIPAGMGQKAMLDFAKAAAMKLNDDAAWEGFEQTGKERLTEYLTEIRELQVQDVPQQEQYL